jgi:hypothetical protein
MSDRNQLFNTDMDNRLFQVCDIVEPYMALHGHNAEQMRFGRQVQIYQMRQDLGAPITNNQQQTVFTKKAFVFSDNTKGMFARRPKAEDQIAKLNIIRDMQREQFRNTVLIMTAAAPMVQTNVPSNVNTRPLDILEMTELVPTEAKVVTMTHFTDNADEADAVETTKVLPMHEVGTAKVYDILVYRERRYKPAC